MLTPGITPVRRVHVTELRVALDAAYAAARRPSPTYDDALVTAGATPVRARHLNELRAAVFALETAPNRAPTAVGAVPALTLTVSEGALAVGRGAVLRRSQPRSSDLRSDPRATRASATASVSGSTITVAPVATGAATVTVTARDWEGLSATQAVSVTVADPDLVVESPGVSGAAVETGASFTLSLTVANRGAGASGTTTLRYYRSSDSTISTGDTEVGAGSGVGSGGGRERAGAGEPHGAGLGGNVLLRRLRGSDRRRARDRQQLLGRRAG